MLAPFRDTVRDRFDLSGVVVYVLIWVGLWRLLDLVATQVAMMVAITAVTSLTEALGDAYNLRAPVKHLGLAAIALGGGGALLALGYEHQWLAVGGWLLLDGIQTVRYAGARKPGADGKPKYHEHVVRCVHDALRDGPLMRRELSDTLPDYIDTSELDDAIATLKERGAIEQAGSGLRIIEDETLGPLGQRFQRIYRVVRRLRRPITVEFDSPRTYP